MIAAILFTVVLGINKPITYDVINDCSHMATTYFPPDDSEKHRVIGVCLEVFDVPKEKIDIDKILPTIQHEVMHSCFHDHTHSFTTKEQLDKHLQTKYAEEYVVENVTADCVLRGTTSFTEAFLLYKDSK